MRKGDSVSVRWFNEVQKSTSRGIVLPNLLMFYALRPHVLPLQLPEERERGNDAGQSTGRVRKEWGGGEGHSHEDYALAL